MSHLRLLTGGSVIMRDMSPSNKLRVPDGPHVPIFGAQGTFGHAFMGAGVCGILFGREQDEGALRQQLFVHVDVCLARPCGCRKCQQQRAQERKRGCAKLRVRARQCAQSVEESAWGGGRGRGSGRDAERAGERTGERERARAMLGQAAGSSSTGLEVCVDECDGMPCTMSFPMLVAGSVFLLASSLLRTLARCALAPSALRSTRPPRSGHDEAGGHVCARGAARSSDLHTRLHI